MAPPPPPYENVDLHHDLQQVFLNGAVNTQSEYKILSKVASQ